MKRKTTKPKERYCGSYPPLTDLMLPQYHYWFTKMGVKGFDLANHEIGGM